MNYTRLGQLRPLSSHLRGLCSLRLPTHSRSVLLPGSHTISPTSYLLPQFRPSSSNAPSSRRSSHGPSSWSNWTSAALPVAIISIVVGGIGLVNYQMKKIPDLSEMQRDALGNKRPEEEGIDDSLMHSSHDQQLPSDGDDNKRGDSASHNDDITTKISSSLSSDNSSPSTTDTKPPIDDDQVDDDEEAIGPTPTYIDPGKAAFPTHIPYLIIGCGTAGLSAAKAIRASDPKAKILLVGSEQSIDDDLSSTTTDEEDKTRSPVAYLRPPLSKELWRRSGQRHDILLESDGDIRRHSWLYYEPDSFYLDPERLSSAEFGGVGLVRDDPVVSLDPDKHEAWLKSGRRLVYNACLLATGASAKRLPSDLEHCSSTGTNLLESGHLSYFRSIADYRRLRELRDRLRDRPKGSGTIAILGGGFLGSELAVSLLNEPSSTNTDVSKSVTNNLKVVHVMREQSPLGRLLPPCLATTVGRFEASTGVEMHSSSQLVDVSLKPSAIDSQLTFNDSKVSLSGGRLSSPQLLTANAKVPDASSKLRLRLRSGEGAGAKIEEIEVDHLVCAVGVQPNTQLAASAGLEIDPTNGGFLVNAELEARSNVYAAGDVASYWDPVVKARRRVEHLNFAEETGELAGRNMAASQVTESLSDTYHPDRDPQRYHFQSSLWSSLGPKVSWDAVGLVDSRCLLTRAFFFDNKSDKPLSDSTFGRMGQGGVVFYLTPSDQRLVGVLLWNLPEDMFDDKSGDSGPRPIAPSRLNVARSLLTDQLIRPDLAQLARRFDLNGQLAREYAELKASSLLESAPPGVVDDKSGTPSSDDVVNRS